MDNDRSPLADCEVHYLTSTNVGDEFKIFVGHCPSDLPGPATVLYLTDANGLFGATVDAIRGMQIVAQLPSLLVVGIGYRTGTIAETVDVRRRDLTPSEDHFFEDPQADQPTMGGAARTLAFIRRELMPWVVSRFDVSPTGATYVGHSLGGLFGAWVLLSQPETFDRYIIGSPSLWWDRYMMVAHEAAYATDHDDLRAGVFFAIGAEETLDGRIRESANLPAEERALVTVLPLDMVEDLDRLVDTLRRRAYPGLSMRHEVLADEFHVTVAPLIVSRGLRHLFGAPR